MKTPIKIGLIGYGTVGRGVVQMICDNRSVIEAKVGAPVELAMICSRSNKRKELKKKGISIPFTTDPQDIIHHPEISIVVELMGGYEPARTYVLEALKAGKHVVTANKALLAKYWGDVFEHARMYRRLVYFEGAVGGGIPVIQTLNEGLAGNRIHKIVGILNGTTNYILTRMSQLGIKYAQALKEAQKAGFAEANPSFDVKGIDVAHKIAILASIASGSWVRIQSVVTQGIMELDPRDIDFVKKEFGYVVKLLGMAKLTEDTIEVSVRPTLIPDTHPFANVHNEYNAVSIEGDAVGDIMLYGRGAGSLAAASAVVSDLTDVARQIAAGTAGKLPYIYADPSKTLKPVPFEQMLSRFYLRFKVKDQPGVLAGIAEILSQHRISIAGVYQPRNDFKDAKGKATSILILTHEVSQQVLSEALQKISKKSYVRSKPVVIHVEE